MHCFVLLTSVCASLNTEGYIDKFNMMIVIGLIEEHGFTCKLEVILDLLLCMYAL